MAASQTIWDMGESSSYLSYTTQGITSSIGPKSFIYAVTENDAQVPNLSAWLAVRSAGIPVVSDSVLEPYGVPVVNPPYQGSALVVFNYGDPPTPDGNLAPDSDFGGHGNMAFTPDAKQMIFHFLEKGEITDTCNGTCDVSSH